MRTYTSATTDSSARLTARDYEILRHIGQHGFSTATWIREKFWQGKKNRLEYRRLSVLRKFGYIEPLIGDGRTHLGYRLTKRGLGSVREDGQHQGLSTYRASYRSTFDHDRYLIGLGTVLQSAPAVSDYQTEHQVRRTLANRYGYKERKSGGYKVPDALFTLRTKQRALRVALELEIATKSKAYCRRVLKHLSMSPDFNVVFMIGANAKMLQRLKESLEWVRANDVSVQLAGRINGVYFALLPDLLEHKDKAKFEGEGTSFTLSQIAG